MVRESVLSLVVVALGGYFKLSHAGKLSCKTVSPNAASCGLAQADRIEFTMFIDGERFEAGLQDLELRVGGEVDAEPMGGGNQPGPYTGPGMSSSTSVQLQVDGPCDSCLFGSVG